MKYGPRKPPLNHQVIFPSEPRKHILGKVVIVSDLIHLKR